MTSKGKKNDIKDNKKMASTTVSWWQYKRWAWNIARNMRITHPVGAELTALRDYIKAFWNPQTKTGLRPWLDGPLKDKAIASKNGNNYEGNIDIEPVHVLVEMAEVIGRNLTSPPIRDGAEVDAVDAFITATGNRRFGTGPNFGGVSGSRVTIV
jgi:hypothetical protein